LRKSVVLGLATNTSAASNSLADLVTTYASALATQVGALTSNGVDQLISRTLCM